MSGERRSPKRNHLKAPVEGRVVQLDEVRPVSGTSDRSGPVAVATIQPPTTTLLHVALAEVDYADVVCLINRTLSDPSRPRLAVDAMNTMGLSESCLDPRMRESLRAYDVIVPDGMPLVWCMNAKGATLSDRVYGPYLTDRVLEGLERPTRVAVIGGYPDAHDRLLNLAGSRYPNAQFVLLHDAPPGDIDGAYVDRCLEHISASQAELVFVCLGVPRQYYWTAIARPRLRGVCMSVGGAFDFITGAKPYAPAWVQRAGLTWLHRLAHEPRRLGRRYLKYNAAFVWLLLTQEVLGRRLPMRLS